MKRLFCEITVGQYTIDFVTEIEIGSSWKNLTDKCSIQIPRKITKDGQPIFAGSNSLFKKGEKVEIKLGYFPDLQTYFVGYIDRVEIDSPVTLHCSDSMYLLKQNPVTKSFKSVNLTDLLNEIVPSGVKVDPVDAELGQFRITNATPCQVLQELKKTYKLDVFFQFETLHVGLRYIPENEVEHDITFEKNIIDHSLEWQNEQDVRIKIKAVSMLPDNTKIEIEVGDPNGEIRSAYYYGLNQTELKRTAENDIPKFKFTGFRGGFSTFGNRAIKHGDIINLTSLKFPEQNGSYFVDSVQTTFGQGGFRQNVELGKKAK